MNFDFQRKYKAVSELPKEEFFVASIWLMENRKVTDQDLSRFKNCKGLWLLGLVGTKVTDAGLAHVKEYLTGTQLSEMYLGDTGITDAGLAHLADCTTLRQLLDLQYGSSHRCRVKPPQTNGSDDEAAGGGDQSHRRRCPAAR